MAARRQGIASRRIQRVMLQSDLPLGARLRRFMLEPLHLLAIEVGAVEREEPHPRIPPRDRIDRRRKGVIAVAIHVERLVEHLLRVVVIAEHRVELDAGVEQQLVRFLELQPVILRGGGPFVDVVARHQDELVVEALPVGDHLRRHLMLGRPAAAAVADHRELDRAVFVRQRQRVGRHGRDVDGVEARLLARFGGLADPAVATARGKKNRTQQ